MTSMEGTPEADSRASTPREMASSAVETVKQEVATFAAKAQDKAVDQIEEKKETATQTLSDFAVAIRRAGDELATKDQSIAGRLVKQAADGLEKFAHSVNDKPPEELLDAVRDFGRRNPVAFVAGAMLTGVALGRFLKSSADHADGPASPGVRLSGASEQVVSEPESKAPSITEVGEDLRVGAEASGSSGPHPPYGSEV